MKKGLVLIFCIFIFLPPVSAKTLSDLYQELYYLEEEKNTSLEYVSIDQDTLMEYQKDLIQQVASMDEQIEKFSQEIETKEQKIEFYQTEIGNLLKAYQLAGNKNIVLEYIVDATTYKDYVYRTMATKQIAKYQVQMMNHYQEEKKKLEEKKNSLEKAKEELEDKRVKYQEIELILKKNQVNSMDSITTSLAEDISSLKEEIKMYKSMGCSNDEELSLCLKIENISSLNYPLQSGCVSKEYEMTSHKGIDLSCNKEGENVYASGKGVVGDTLNQTSCGGNIVFIYHNIGGKKYTSIYGHLLEIKVVPGQVVDENTVIGLLGGESTASINGGYDKCTNGAHLHYAISEDYHTYDFGIYTKNPRNFNVYPNLLSGFFSR